MAGYMVAGGTVKTTDINFTGYFYAVETYGGKKGFYLDLSSQYAGYKNIELSNISMIQCTVYNYSGASGNISPYYYDPSTGMLFVANTTTTPDNALVTTEITIRIYK